MKESRNLEVLKFSISDREKNDKVLMDNIDGRDLIDVIFNKFISFIATCPVDSYSKRVIKLLKEKNGNYFFKKQNSTITITGIVETGKYGKEEAIIDVEDEGKTVFQKRKNHSVQKPFFFLICISNLKKDGIIMLEKEGVLGIKYIFRKVLSDFCKQEFKNHKISITNFIDKEVINNYINKGEYNSIKLIQNSLPSDVTDRYGLEKFEKDDYVLELTLKKKGHKKISGREKQRIQKMLKGEEYSFFVSEDLKNVGFDETSIIKVKSTYNNSPRTINLSDTMKFRPYYKVNVEINSTGHSEFNSIQKEALKLLESFNLELY